jgi:nucleotide-binding universal stress UspA family protein
MKVALFLLVCFVRFVSWWFNTLAEAKDCDCRDEWSARRYQVRILVCVHGMPQAAPVLSYARVVATLQGAEVALLAVVDEAGKRPSAIRQLETAKETFGRPIEEMAVRVGAPAAEIVRASESGAYDLIVLGAGLVNRFLDNFPRPTLDEVATQAHSSVLVVKEATAALKHILICTGGAGLSQAAVRAGADLAKAANAAVELLYVADNVPAMYTGLQTMEEPLVELLRSNTPLARHLQWASQYLLDAGVEAHLKMRRGVVTDEIAAEANKEKYDLVIVGAPSEANLWQYWMMDNVASRLLRNVPTSIYLIREPGESGGE